MCPASFKGWWTTCYSGRGGAGELWVLKHAYWSLWKHSPENIALVQEKPTRINYYCGSRQRTTECQDWKVSERLSTLNFRIITNVTPVTSSPYHQTVSVLLSCFLWNTAYHPPSLYLITIKTFNTQYSFLLIAVLKSSTRFWDSWRPRPCPILSSYYRCLAQSKACNKCLLNDWKDIPAKWISIFFMNMVDTIQSFKSHTPKSRSEEYIQLCVKMIQTGLPSEAFPYSYPLGWTGSWDWHFSSPTSVCRVK